MTDSRDAVQLQREYYTATAQQYDALHLEGIDEEHYLALSILSGMADYLKATSILDVGSGTGRALLYLKEKNPQLRVVGVEPVQALREVGYQKGLSPQELIDGDATRLAFADHSFDIVCEFGVLHHIAQPEVAVKEMLRVAKTAIFISDSNRFGQGSFVARTIKQMIGAVGLWPVANWVKTRGKGYMQTPGDGICYSYSVYDNYALIKNQCAGVHTFNTTPQSGVNPYRTASHVALLGIKANQG